MSCLAAELCQLRGTAGEHAQGCSLDLCRLEKVSGKTPCIALLGAAAGLEQHRSTGLAHPEALLGAQVEVLQAALQLISGQSQRCNK